MSLDDVLVEALSEARAGRSVRIRFARDADAINSQKLIIQLARKVGLDIDSNDTRLCRCVGPSADMAEFYGHVYHAPGVSQEG